jgi:hypothetical protein
LKNRIDSYIQGLIAGIGITTIQYTGYTLENVAKTAFMMSLVLAFMVVTLEAAIWLKNKVMPGQDSGL